jgi:hypothetical protein
MSYEVPAVKKEILLTLDSFVENLGKAYPTRFCKLYYQEANMGFEIKPVPPTSQYHQGKNYF